MYNHRVTSVEIRLMTTYKRSEKRGFSACVAQLRKTGYTQEQLATELGISRRRVAYWEAESDHPPAGLLTAQL